MGDIKCPHCQGELKYITETSYVYRIYGKGGWYERLQCSNCNWKGQHIEFR